MPLARRFFLVALISAPAAGQTPAALEPIRVSRAEDGVRLSYSARLELPRALDDALHKGVALYFVADARLTRVRWYWRDAVVAAGQRQWRLVYQPLTRQYRLSTGGLHQSYDSLADALGPISRAGAWTLPLREEPDPDTGYQLRFSLRLDPTLLPAPLQIGLGPGASLQLSREQTVPAEALMPASPGPTPAPASGAAPASGPGA